MKKTISLKKSFLFVFLFLSFVVISCNENSKSAKEDNFPAEDSDKISDSDDFQDKDSEIVDDDFVKVDDESISDGDSEPDDESITDGDSETDDNSIDEDIDASNDLEADIDFSATSNGWENGKTTLVTDINIDSFAWTSIEGEACSSHDDKFFCIYSKEIYSSQLAVISDGKATVIADGKEIKEIAYFKGSLYFTVKDNNDKKLLFQSDGTASGTYQILEDASITEMIVFNDYLYIFDSFNGQNGLWRVSSPESELELVQLFDEKMKAEFHIAGQKLYCFVNNYLTESENRKMELWVLEKNTTSKVLDKTGYYAVYFYPFNDSAYFTLGYILYKTDGTAEGTILLKDSTVEQDINVVSSMITENGSLFFFVGTNLWKTDGTLDGTLKVLDWSGDETVLGIAGNFLYFKIPTESGLIYFMRTDGTVDGTLLIKEFDENTNPAGATEYKNSLYIQAGTKLWKTDGTNIEEISELSGEFKFYKFNEKLYWVTYTTISFTDGEKTEKIFDYSHADDTSFSSKSLYFSGNTFYAVDAENKLYKTNEAGDEMTKIADILSPTPLFITAVSGDSLLLKSRTRLAPNQIYLQEFYRYKESTSKFEHITVKKASSNPQLLFFDNESFYFTAYSKEDGLELWKTDGTSENTTIVSDLETSQGSASSSIKSVISLATATYFAEVKNESTIIWKKEDGKLSETISTITGKILDENGFQQLDDNSFVFVVTNTEGGKNELWKSDGTSNGTFILTQYSGPIYFQLNDSGIIYFIGWQEIGKPALYRTDGTVKGTFLLQNLSLNISSTESFFIKMVKNGEKLFGTLENEEGRFLFTTDGTVDGTKKVGENLIIGKITDITSYKNSIFIVTDSGNLWKTDGTDSGTVLATETGISGVSKIILTANKNYLYLTGYENRGLANSPQFTAVLLIRTNGTEAGAEIIEDLRVSKGKLWNFSVTDTSIFYQLSEAENNINYKIIGENGLGKTELINSGIVSNMPFLFNTKTLENQIFFIAYDSGSKQNQLFVSGGTKETTHILDASSKVEPSELFGIIENKLIFKGSSSQFGEELFVYEKSVE